MIVTSLIGLSGDSLLENASYLGLPHNAQLRLQEFVNPADNWPGDDGTSRLDFVPFALQNFSNHPLLGNGIRFIKVWGEILPHNIYLYLMVESGFLGALIYSTLVLLIVNKSFGEARSISQAFAVFVLIWGIFSHNILEEHIVRLAFAMMTAMNVNNQREYKLKMKYLEGI